MAEECCDDVDEGCDDADGFCDDASNADACCEESEVRATST